MKAISLLAAVAVVATQACASALNSTGTPYGTNFGEIRSDRPSVADALRPGQTALAGFGTSPSQRSVPSSLPLPASVKLGTRMVVPALNRRAGVAIYGTAGVLLQIACVLPTLDGTSDPKCEDRMQRQLDSSFTKPAATRGPVILR